VVNGSITVTVLGGACSPAIAVPAGTATVLEQSTLNFHLVGIPTAVGPDGSNRLISGTNPITVSVPFGGVGNETLVTFTNAVNTGQFKICKTTTATSDGSGVLLGGLTFNYEYQYSVDGVLTDAFTSLQIPAGSQSGVIVCTGLFGPIPVEQFNGLPVTIGVQEAAFPGVHILSITYAGNGALQTGVTANPAFFTLGQGVNILTFDNEPNPPGTVTGNSRRIG
jgi:hypothetical protein